LRCIHLDRRILAKNFNDEPLVVTLCAPVMFFDGFDPQSISYQAPRIAREWGLPPSQLGPIFSAALLGLMIGYLVLAPLSDRFGHRRTLITATVAFAAFTLASAWTGTPGELIALRVLTGLGLGAAAPSAVALTGEFSPRRLRATFVLIIYCGFSLGFAAAGVVAGWLLPAHGWRSMFWVGAIVPLILIPVLVRFLPESPAHLVARRRPTAEVLAVLRRIEQSWLPTILTDLHYPLSTVVTATTLTTVGGIAAGLLTGPCMDRLGAYGTVATVYVLGFVFVGLTRLALVGPGGAVPLWLMLAATFAAGCCVSGGQKSVIALAAVFYPTSVSSGGVGWALGIGRIGGIVGPLAVAAALAAHWSTHSVFFVLAVPMAVAGAAVLVMGRRYR
jgi:AAHS family 4-hydroxybenzoate transporter-like MFS transporter